LINGLLFQSFFALFNAFKLFDLLKEAKTLSIFMFQNEPTSYKFLSF